MRFIALLSLLPSLAFGAIGGPDAFGYVWVDSDEFVWPGYSWSSAATTPLNASDDG